MGRVSKQKNYTDSKGRTWSAVYCLHPDTRKWAAWAQRPDGSIYNCDSYSAAVKWAESEASKA